jgi:glutamate---methylamine ligase
MNWAYDDALVTADRHVFFKFMVKELAGQHGLRATFMPKPFMHLTGNGCHAHVSLWDNEGDINLFHDPEGALGLSALAYHFLGGILTHAEALSALFTPTVNSFKRINARPLSPARPGRPMRSVMAATTAPTWCGFRSRAGSSCA